MGCFKDTPEKLRSLTSWRLFWPPKVIFQSVWARKVILTYGTCLIGALHALTITWLLEVKSCGPWPLGGCSGLQMSITSLFEPCPLGGSSDLKKSFFNSKGLGCLRKCLGQFRIVLVSCALVLFKMFRYFMGTGSAFKHVTSLQSLFNVKCSIWNHNYVSVIADESLTKQICPVTPNTRETTVLLLQIQERQLRL